MATVMLLGSGISVDAGMPRVDDITREVISGDGVWRHTSGAFVRGDGASPVYEMFRPPVEPVLALVRELQQRADAYFGRPSSYEEISQLAQQIAHSDPETGEHPNPAVAPLVDELGYDDELLARCSAAGHYVADVVLGVLAKPPDRLDHLRSIVDACRRLDRVTLATLNHDLVLETALETSGVAYADGFERSGSDVWKWADVWDATAVPVIKLHGSIDWWRYAFAGEEWRGSIVARFRGDDPDHPARRDVLGGPYEPRPLFLLGTFDKILSYETSVFLDQHLQFRKDLRSARQVVVIGYGFGDKAINSRLIGWMDRSRDNRLVVCHKHPDVLLARARGAIRTAWEGWLRAGRITIIPAFVDDLAYADLSSHLAGG